MNPDTDARSPDTVIDERLVERVERLIVRYEELQRTNALLAEQLKATAAERDSLKSRLAAARAREPDDLDLELLEGQALALAGRHADAAASFAAIAARAPKFRYGAPWLARADALAAGGQWAEADAALAQFQRVNSSSIEGHVKRARALARQGDRAGAARERAAGRALYGELPRFQRRHQRWWYVRAWLGR